MKISKKLRAILSSYSIINPGIMFKEGNILSTISPLNTIMSTCVIDTTCPQDFCISNLSEFINIISIISDNHEITFNDYQMIINSGKSIIKYTLADPDTITYSGYDEPVFDNTLTSFMLDSFDLSAIIKASSILKSSEILIKGNSKGITITSGKLKEKSASRFTKKIDDILIEPRIEFERIFNLDNLKIIDGTYRITLPDDPFMEMISTNEENQMKYWIVASE
jgi:hypothetical protein